MAAHFGAAAGFLRSIALFFRSISILKPQPVRTQLQVNLSAHVVTDVGFNHQNVAGFDVVTGIQPIWGPVSLTFGPTEVVTGLTWDAAKPLEPVGQPFDDGAARIDAAKTEIENMRNYLDDIKGFTGDGKHLLDDMISDVLKPLPAQLEEASQGVQEMSTSVLLTLIPLFVLTYFGLIHLAFALTGLALLL